VSADSNAHSEIGRDVVRDRNALQAEQRGTRKELVVPWWRTFIFVCFYYIPAVVALRYLWQQIASVRAGE
jgi:hypothetical protein